MYSAITDDYLVADDTLILYRGKEPQVRIPREIQPGHPIRKIGAFAFAYKQALESVEIPKGVCHIGGSAFLSCESLQEVHIPDSVTVIGLSAFSGCNANLRVWLTLPRGTYSALLSGSLAAADGSRYLKDPAAIPALAGLPQALDLAPLARIPDAVPWLLEDPLDPSSVGRRRAFTERTAIRFDGEGGNLSEDDALRLLTRKGFPEAVSPSTEQQNDRYLRTERQPPYNKATLVSFPSEAAGTGDRVELPISFHQGYFFWQSAVKVRCKGHLYFLYRRNYLTGGDSPTSLRMDMAVYDENGLVTDRKRTEEVYAKYKLLALL